jgi:hypothetical protein
MMRRRQLMSALLGYAATAAVLTTVLAAASAALAAERPFPTFAKRGTMKPDLFPAIIIDGRPRILTPGARIWNANNMIDMPASLPQTNVVVNYTEDENAYIDRVWILTPEEAAQSPKAQNINQPRP